jgi:glycosyltransferase involved in cell wall biosynthesis
VRPASKHARSPQRRASVPQVSVLIPTYSRPMLLERALRSVVGQEAKDHVEIIVGDDGEVSDGVISKFGSRIRHLRNLPRLGLSANVNNLAREAEGEFLAFVMDDDYWLPDFLSKSLSAFREMADLGIVFTNHFFENGHRTVRKCDLPAGRHDDFSVKLLRYNPVPISSSLIRRAVWDEASPLPDTDAFDLVLWARAAEKGYPFFYIEEPLMVYKANPSGLSASRAFRHEVVVALEGLRFSDPAAQALLRRRLRAALYSRAKGNVAEGKLIAAIADLVRLLTVLPRRREDHLAN